MAITLPSEKAKGRRPPMSDINVTPMVDVMLVLLIIFMVTAPLLTAGVPVNLPDSRAKPVEQDHKPLQISLDVSGRVFVDDSPVTDADFPGALAARVKAAPAGEPPHVFLRADKQLEYGRVAAVMGELNRAGLNKVSLITTAKDQDR